MRPRPDAAENPLRKARWSASFPASMRPRPDAAENAVCRTTRLGLVIASMRPRPDAAENVRVRRRRRLRRRRFNEAAARCRGKPASGRWPWPARRRASMRPRPDAAENSRSGTVSVAVCGASMRPRPDAAENREREDRARHNDRASMRPRPDAAENCGRCCEGGVRVRGFNEAADQRQLFWPVGDGAIGGPLDGPCGVRDCPFSSGRTGWSRTHRFGVCARRGWPGRHWRRPRRRPG